jgi:hypothetical protein
MYYGKFYPGYISDDHEGLDLEVKSYLLKGLQQDRIAKNLPPITDEIYIGVMSLSSHAYIPTWSSREEYKCFDFYCEIYKEKTTMYINGAPLTLAL